MKVTRAALLVAGIISISARAADFPTRPVTLVVPYSAGGSIDAVARIIADRLGQMWKQAVVVDSRPGANGNIATSFVANGPADGYTLLIQGPAIMANPAIYGNLKWDPRKDFAGLAMLCWSLNVLVVSTDFKVNSLKDFVSLAKQKPGEIFYMNPGVGSSNHLGTELFKKAADVDLPAVNYKGQSQAMGDLLSGRVTFGAVALNVALPHISAGRLKPLALLASKRSALLPNVPTVAEAGYPGAELVPWYGLYARAQTPKSTIDFINTSVLKVLAMPDVREAMEKIGQQSAAPMSAAAMDQLVVKDFARWSGIVKEANIKAE